MDVVRLRGDEDLVAGVRVRAAIDAHDDVDALVVDVGVAVQVAVGSELLDEVDLDRQASAALGDSDVFGANTDRDALGLGLTEGCTVDLGDCGTELEAAVDNLAEVLDGRGLDAVVDALTADDEASRLAELAA